MTLSLSILIRNKNEERYIGYCIQSVKDHVPEDHEFVIVDNDSVDGSLEIVKSFCFDELEIHKLKGYYTPGAALNFGIEKCISDYVLILSAHAELIKFDKNVFSLFDNDVVSVFGKQIPIHKGKRITPRYIWANFGNQQEVNLFSEFENRYFLHNACALYKRDILVKYPFRENLSTKEDRYWANEMITNHNKKILYEPNLIQCKHHYTVGGATWAGIG